MSFCVSRMHSASLRDRHADVGRPHAPAGLGRPWRPRPRRGGPATSCCAPRPGWSRRSRRRHAPRRCACTISACSLVPASVPWNSSSSRFLLGRLSLEYLFTVSTVHGVHQLDARHRDAGLDGLDHGVDRALEAVEGAGRGDHRFGNAVEAQRDLGDDAQRAFGADEQLHQVVARARLARAAAEPHDAAVGDHDLQRQHVLAHGAVAHGVGAGGAGAGHAADRGVGAGIDREEQTRSRACTR